MMRFVIIVGLLIQFSCNRKQEEVAVVVEEESENVNLASFGKEKLSEYGFFKGDMKNLQPAEDVVPYSINAQLFSDYAHKKRFVKIPTGSKAAYNAKEVFEFPVGTVLIKNFYYPADFNKPEENIRMLETRLLIRETDGWKTLPYVWNQEQTEAYLEIAGRNLDVSWKHTDGQIKNISYSVPNVNQCKGCHLKGDQVAPIGPSARQLNKTVENKNQLSMWLEAGLIDQLPELKLIPKLVDYENDKELIFTRARAWLEINCAHCHRPDGPAKTSGLHLAADVTNLLELGVGKAPVAAGKGSGGRLFSIVPGKPDQSIIQFRIESIDPGIMMPEMGRKLVHAEGVELVKQWIEKMESVN